MVIDQNIIVVVKTIQGMAKGRAERVGVCRRAVASECESLLLPFIDFATFRSRFPYTNTVTLSQVTETSATLHAGEQVSSRTTLALLITTTAPRRAMPA